MHVHLIENDFLSQSRHDPITGDLFVAGDKVVFCAACHSAFLLESWEYLGQTHCQQQETLAQIPTQSNLTLKQDGTQIGEDYFYYLDTNNQNALYCKDYNGIFDFYSLQDKKDFFLKKTTTDKITSYFNANTKIKKQVK
ncbi:hypothetical protein [Hugenholtzia roseola]|uniref:hypothetical protein n=1 Tax=Hugenholtzia roseola TaxID=1002 RepID=UPI0004210C42|nr:hypothetical protein [Hugenholtzia roseola]